MKNFSTLGECRKHWMLWHYIFEFMAKNDNQYPPNGKIEAIRKMVSQTTCPDDDKPLRAERTCNHGC